MGRAGEPVDQGAWEWRRRRAAWLLEQGYPHSTVARSIGASKSWVQRINQERLAGKSNAKA